MVFFIESCTFPVSKRPPGYLRCDEKIADGLRGIFNRRHRRHGQLFQNRFKSVICQEDRYSRELVRYIHLNPLRAGIVSNLDELDRYPYCGHGTLVGKEKRDWQERIKSDQRILGDGDFVLEILAQSEEDFSRRYRLKSRGLDFEKVVQKVSSLLDLEESYILARGRERKRVIARDLVCYSCAVELEIPMADLARRLKMTVAGVSYDVKRGENVAKESGWSLDHSFI